MRCDNPRCEVVADLRERLRLAECRLDVMAEQNSDHDEVLRLSGKAEGVALALSYLRDLTIPAPGVSRGAEPAPSSTTPELGEP